MIKVNVQLVIWWPLTSCVLLLLSSVVSSSIRSLLGSDWPWLSASLSVLSDWSGCGGLEDGAADTSSSSRQKGWISGASTGSTSSVPVGVGLQRNNKKSDTSPCVVMVTERWFDQVGPQPLTCQECSPAASLPFSRGGTGDRIRGGWRSCVAVLICRCGYRDGWHPASHGSRQGRGTTRLHLQRPAAASRGCQRTSRGLLRKTTGEEGVYWWHHWIDRKVGRPNNTKCQISDKAQSNRTAIFSSLKKKKTQLTHLLSRIILQYLKGYSGVNLIHGLTHRVRPFLVVGKPCESITERTW